MHANHTHRENRRQLPSSASLLKRVTDAVTPLSDTLTAEAVSKIDNKTKPPGSLGRIEELAVQICRIQNTLNPEIRQKQLFVFAGDHGITQDGVSAFPAEVTAQMVDNFLNGGAAINILCRHYHIDMKVVDMGVAADFAPHPDLLIRKVAPGTKNFAGADAMSGQETVTALENGITVFLETYEKTPVDIVGLGEMGIGNTTSASCIISAVTGIGAAASAGRGTGMDDRGLARKIEVMEKALDFHKPDPGNGFDILRKMGGFEIAGIAGACLAAASKGTAVVLDGVISTAAGLIAYMINPDIKGYLIAGHKSVEKAQAAALDHMDLAPLVDYHMRLGEGTGAAMAMDTVEAACKIMCEMASSAEARVATPSIKSG